MDVRVIHGVKSMVIKMGVFVVMDILVYVRHRYFEIIKCDIFNLLKFLMTSWNFQHVFFSVHVTSNLLLS